MTSPRFSGKPRKLSRLASPILLRRVVGDSMLPTLKPGQIVVAIRLTQRLKPGQVIIFERQGREQIKRIAQLRDGRVYVLGDNPGRSTDSRTIGWIAHADVRARVLMR